MANCAPTILITRPKFHILLHLLAFIRRFGTAVIFSTERFKSFNKVFRSCSILSNKLSPSFDILTRFLHLEQVKHIASGGWICDGVTGRWTQPSPTLVRVVELNREFGRMIGLDVAVVERPGKLTLNNAIHLSFSLATKPRNTSGICSILVRQNEAQERAIQQDSSISIRSKPLYPTFVTLPVGQSGHLC